VFALAIYGGTRFIDLRRAHREAAAWAFGTLAVLAVAAFAAATAYGILVMANKA